MLVPQVVEGFLILMMRQETNLRSDGLNVPEGLSATTARCRVANEFQ